jgi:hypothetical protein
LAPAARGAVVVVVIEVRDCERRNHHGGEKDEELGKLHSKYLRPIRLSTRDDLGQENHQANTAQP